MFSGECEHTVDDKGRLIIPAKFRADLAKGYLFSLDASISSIISELSLDEIPAELRAEFDAHGYSLSARATIKKKSDDSWIVKDEKREYVLQQENNRLNVYIEGLVVTRGLEGCLFVFPLNKWKEMSEKMSSLSLVQSSARLFSRMMYSGIECKLDKQGRILLPPSLRAHADIVSEVVINGVMTRLEIWSKKRWQEQTIRMEEESSFIAEQLVNLGF